MGWSGTEEQGGDEEAHGRDKSCTSTSPENNAHACSTVPPSNVWDRCRAIEAQTAQRTAPTNRSVHSVQPQHTCSANSRPSALTHVRTIAERAQHKRLCIFLDYDGTLTPIVDDPWHAHMHESARAAVQRIASVCCTAIISGRSREKVQEFVNVPGLYYAGSHGLDIGAPGGKGCLVQPPEDVKCVMNSLHERLSHIAQRVHGAIVEHNAYCVSVHHRRCNAPDRQHLESLVEQELAKWNEVRLSRGRKVLEVRPNIDWDKGKALAYLITELNYSSSLPCLPVYCGDDWTDEDAFRACKQHNGVSIVVSRSDRPSEAEMSLRCPEETREFLLELATHIQQQQQQRLHDQHWEETPHSMHHHNNHHHQQRRQDHAVRWDVDLHKQHGRSPTRDGGYMNESLNMSPMQPKLPTAASNRGIVSTNMHSSSLPVPQAKATAGGKSNSESDKSVCMSDQH